jgi:hypothetical protein
VNRSNGREETHEAPEPLPDLPFLVVVEKVAVLAVAKAGLLSLTLHDEVKGGDDGVNFVVIAIAWQDGEVALEVPLKTD